MPRGWLRRAAGGTTLWLGDLVRALLVAVLLALFVRTWVLQVFEIPTASMESALLRGDHVLVNRFIFGLGAADAPPWLPMRPPQRGDVVVFRFPPDPSRDYVKRTLGLPGDVVEIVDKELRLDGNPLEESAYAEHIDPRVYKRSLFLHDGYRKRDNFGPIVVPPRHYFVLGDNRDDSYDSRFWGQVSRRLLKGRVLLVLWSLEPRSPPPPLPQGAPPDGDIPPPVAAPPSVADSPPSGPPKTGLEDLAQRVRWLRTLRPVR
jgi:signal peptidase I